MVKIITSIREIPQNANVVLDFYADWCGPCKRIAPMFVEMSARYPDIVFLKVNVDESEDLSSAFQINALPTFVFVKKGVIEKRIEGVAIQEMLETLETISHE
jgi:thioredoxin 1